MQSICINRRCGDAEKEFFFLKAVTGAKRYGDAIVGKSLRLTGACVVYHQNGQMKLSQHAAYNVKVRHHCTIYSAISCQASLGVITTLTVKMCENVK